MTRFTVSDLGDEWEFKIVRSGSSAFRKPEVFQQLLDEESVAGWVLVEKLDDARVRFKRPARSRRDDGMLPAGVDPYRTKFGTVSPGVIAVSLVISASLAVAVVFYILAKRGSQFVVDGSAWVIIALAGTFIICILMVVVVIIQRQR